MSKSNFIRSNKLILLVLLSFISGIVHAQNTSLKGIVKDKKTGEALPGVGIYVKGGVEGTISDIDGKFEVSVPVNSTLSVTFIGYKTLEIPAKTFPSTLLMEEDAFVLEDAVVIGYATGSKRTVSGAVQKVGQKDMNVGVIPSPLDAIQGKVAGVNIQRTGGDPTANPSVRIRGTTSLTGGNDPLVVVDGIFGDLGLLNSLSPNDIESFTILKDASETAQYGSRGASGVIVVTTQKGKAGYKSLNYDGKFGIESVYKNIDMLDADGYRRAVAKYKLNALDGKSSTNFIEEMQRTGYTQTHNLSLGGGTESSNYRAAIGVIDQQGIIRNNSTQNYTGKFDIGQRYFDNKLKLEMGLIGSKIQNNYLNDHTKTFYSAAAFNPTLPATQNPDGTWPEDVNANEVDNPIGRLSIKDKSSVTLATIQSRLSYNITSDLMFGAFGSYTYNSKELSKYVPTNIKAGIRDRGFGERKLEKTESLMGNLSLNYKKVINKHRVDLLAVIEGQEYKFSGFNAGARGYDTDYFGFDNLKAGAIVKYGDVGSYSNGYKLFSYLGRANYVFDNKYIFTVNFRADGSSKLGANDKWGYFPSASVGWSLKDEAFLKDIKAINELKLRAGYGVTGNQDAIAPYNSLFLMVPTGITELNGTKTVTFGYARNPNPDLRWETKKMYDIGVDAAFFSNRLSVNIDYYQSITSNLLYQYDVPVPPFQHPKLLANLGELENKGLEVSISVSPIKTKDIDFTIASNITFQKTKINSLSGTYMGQNLSPGEYMSLGGVSGAGAIGGNNNVVYQMVDQPLGVFYIPKSNGLIKNAYDDSYTYNILDLDNSGDIDIANGKDRYFAGQAMPKVLLGANLSFRYKSFDVQTQLNGAFGHKIFNGTSLSYMNMNTFPTYNVLAKAPDANIKDRTVSDYWLEKGDYLQIAYLSLGYNVNTKKIASVVKTLRISFSINNLYTFTNYSGLSPLINNSVVNDKLGIDDRNFYPLSRTYALGLNITF